jgi:hypothetical protein
MKNAGQAKSLMGEMMQVVDNVNHHVEQMAGLVETAMKTSEETGKIIKNIDEIAFQTNLLALNAAVEAARAGEAGANELSAAFCLTPAFLRSLMDRRHNQPCSHRAGFVAGKTSRLFYTVKFNKFLDRLRRFI